MVNSGSFDTDGQGDRNAKTTCTQPQAATSDSTQSSSPVTASAATSCKIGCCSQTADNDELPTPTKTEFNSDMPQKNALGERRTSTSSDEDRSSLCCSLPLDKVQDVLPPPTHSKAAGDDDNDAAPAPTLAKSSRKLLCLYCERTFVSANLRQKHVDRVHSAKKNRRASSRKQQSQSVIACVYCDKLNATENTLTDLFQHLVKEHSSKYFGCLTCEDRFLTYSLLTDHIASVHQSEPVPARGNVTSPSQTTVSEPRFAEQPVKITRSRAKPKPELPGDEATQAAAGNKSAKLKKLSIKSSRIALKRRESKRLQALAKLPSAQKKRKPKPAEKKPAAEQVSGSAKLTDKAKSNQSSFNPYPEFDHFYRVKKITDHSIDNLKISSLTFDDVFDKAFFTRIKCNIEENLLHHIDGKLFENEESESRISNFEKVPTVQQEIQNSSSDNYGCELSLNAVTPVPSLSLNSQFGEDFESQIEYGSKPSKKKTQTKKDEVHYKYFTRRKFQASILEQKENRDLSKLDMWTQLVIKRRQQKIIHDKKSDKEILEYNTCNEYKSKLKREELNRILDRRGPFEDLRQEATKKAALDKLNSVSDDSISQETFKEVREVLDDILMRVFAVTDRKDVVTLEEKANSSQKHDLREIPSYLNLRRCSTISYDDDIDRSDKIALICSSQETENYELPTNQVREKNELVELSGEWARCRMYICAACGAKLPNMKYLLDHKSLYHQNIWVQHYEFVGNQSELYRHLSIPALGKVGAVEDCVQCKVWKRSDARVCTKCGKQCNSLGELHRHVLECGGDWTWMLARKKCKYKPYGAKSRRKRRGLVHRIRNKQKTDVTEGKKKYKKTFEGPRQRPSDAETIQRMLANLPAKRSTRKLISLYDGVCRTKKNNQIQQQQNVNQKKVKCGKVIYKSSNIKETTEKTINTTMVTVPQKNTNSNRRSLRNLNRVLSSRILDTNTKLTVRRKLKVLNDRRKTRQSLLANEVTENPSNDEAELASNLSDLPQNKKDKNEKIEIAQNATPSKRSSPRTSTKNIKKMSMKKLLTGNINIKSFFPVKKRESKKALRENENYKTVSDSKSRSRRKSNDLPEGNVAKVDPKAIVKKTKNDTFGKLVRSLSIRKKKSQVDNSSKTASGNEEKISSSEYSTESPATNSKTDVDNSNNKRRLKRSFRNVINRVKKLKIDNPSDGIHVNELSQNKGSSESEVKNSFLEERRVEKPNLPPQPVKIVIPSNLEAKENIADISETAHTVMNFDETNEDSPVPENIFKLESNNEKNLQAKGELNFDTKPDNKVIAEDIGTKIAVENTVQSNEKTRPIAIETSMKPKIVPLVSPNMKGKIRKPARGLNDCIAMLTSKLQEKTSETLAKVDVFNLLPSNSAPKVTESAPKTECILKIPSFRAQKEVFEETALDLSTKPKNTNPDPSLFRKLEVDNLSQHLTPSENSCHKPPTLTETWNTVDKIIEDVVENKGSTLKRWNSVDEIIQTVVNGYQLKDCQDKIRNTVDEVIDFVVSYGKENNVAVSGINQPIEKANTESSNDFLLASLRLLGNSDFGTNILIGDTTKNKTTRKIGSLRKFKKNDPKIENDDVDKTLPVSSNENHCAVEVQTQGSVVCNTNEELNMPVVESDLNGNGLSDTKNIPATSDITKEKSQTSSNGSAGALDSTLDRAFIQPLLMNLEKVNRSKTPRKLGQTRKSKCKQRSLVSNEASQPEKLVLETHLDDFLNVKEINNHNELSVSSFKVSVGSESHAKELILSNEDEPRVLENKTVFSFNPSDSEDDIPLISLVKPNEPNVGENKISPDLKLFTEELVKVSDTLISEQVFKKPLRSVKKQETKTNKDNDKERLKQQTTVGITADSTECSLTHITENSESNLDFTVTTTVTFKTPILKIKKLTNRKTSKAINKSVAAKTDSISQKSENTLYDSLKLTESSDGTDDISEAMSSDVFFEKNLELHGNTSELNDEAVKKGDSNTPKVIGETIASTETIDICTLSKTVTPVENDVIQTDVNTSTCQNSNDSADAIPKEKIKRRSKSKSLRNKEKSYNDIIKKPLENPSTAGISQISSDGGEPPSQINDSVEETDSLSLSVLADKNIPAVETEKIDKLKDSIEGEKTLSFPSTIQDIIESFKGKITRKNGKRLRAKKKSTKLTISKRVETIDRNIQSFNSSELLVEKPMSKADELSVTSIIPDINLPNSAGEEVDPLTSMKFGNLSINLEKAAIDSFHADSLKQVRVSSSSFKTESQTEFLSHVTNFITSRKSSNILTDHSGDRGNNAEESEHIKIAQEFPSNLTEDEPNAVTGEISGQSASRNIEQEIILVPFGSNLREETKTTEVTSNEDHSKETVKQIRAVAGPEIDLVRCETKMPTTSSNTSLNNSTLNENSSSNDDESSLNETTNCRTLESQSGTDSMSKMATRRSSRSLRRNSKVENNNVGEFLVTNTPLRKTSRSSKTSEKLSTADVTSSDRDVDYKIKMPSKGSLRPLRTLAVDESPKKVASEEAPIGSLRSLKTLTGDESPKKVVSEDAPIGSSRSLETLAVGESPKKVVSEEAPIGISRSLGTLAVDESPKEVAIEEAPIGILSSLGTLAVDESPKKVAIEEAPIGILRSLESLAVDESPKKVVSEEAPTGSSRSLGALAVDESPKKMASEEAPMEDNERSELEIKAYRKRRSRSSRNVFKIPASAVSSLSETGESIYSEMEALPESTSNFKPNSNPKRKSRSIQNIFEEVACSRANRIGINTKQSSVVDLLMIKSIDAIASENGSNKVTRASRKKFEASFFDDTFPNITRESNNIQRNELHESPVLPTNTQPGKEVIQDKEMETSSEQMLSDTKLEKLSVTRSRSLKNSSLMSINRDGAESLKHLYSDSKNSATNKTVEKLKLMTELSIDDSVSKEISGEEQTVVDNSNNYDITTNPEVEDTLLDSKADKQNKKRLRSLKNEDSTSNNALVHEELEVEKPSYLMNPIKELSQRRRTSKRRSVSLKGVECREQSDGVKENIEIEANMNMTVPRPIRRSRSSKSTISSSETEETLENKSASATDFFGNVVDLKQPRTKSENLVKEEAELIDKRSTSSLKMTDIAETTVGSSPLSEKIHLDDKKELPLPIINKLDNVTDEAIKIGHVVSKAKRKSSMKRPKTLQTNTETMIHKKLSPDLESIEGIYLRIDKKSKMKNPDTESILSAADTFEPKAPSGISGDDFVTISNENNTRSLRKKSAVNYSEIEDTSNLIEKLHENVGKGKVNRESASSDKKVKHKKASAALKTENHSESIVDSLQVQNDDVHNISLANAVKNIEDVGELSGKDESYLLDESVGLEEENLPTDASSENVMECSDRVDKQSKKSAKNRKSSTKSKNKSKTDIDTQLGTKKESISMKDAETAGDTLADVLKILEQVNDNNEKEPAIKMIISTQKTRRKSKSTKKIDQKGQNDLFEDFALVVKKKRLAPLIAFTPANTFLKESSYPVFVPTLDEPDATQKEEVRVDLDDSVEEMDMEIDEIPINSNIIENCLKLPLDEENDVPTSDSKPENPFSKFKSGRKIKSRKNKNVNKQNQPDSQECHLENDVSLEFKSKPVLEGDMIENKTEYDIAKKIFHKKDKRTSGTPTQPTDSFKDISDIDNTIENNSSFDEHDSIESIFSPSFERVSSCLNEELTIDKQETREIALESGNESSVHNVDRTYEESSSKVKDIDRIYAFSETEDLEIEKPLDLPRRLPKHQEINSKQKVPYENNVDLDKSDSKKKTKLSKGVSNLMCENQEIIEDEFKEDVVEAEENGRRKSMRTAKVKALEHIHDDALAELKDHERKREVKTVKSTEIESVDNSSKRNYNKKVKKSQKSSLPIDELSFPRGCLTGEEVPLLADLVAELHGLEELENSIERELNAETEEKISVQQSNDTEIPLDPAMTIDQEENQERRRSRRGSRKVASYNEIDLIDPLLDEINTKKKTKKKDDRNLTSQKKTKQPEKKLNSDELFDLLKASTTEHIHVLKQKNSFLDSLGDASRDSNVDNFESMFKTGLEKSTNQVNLEQKSKEDIEKIYEFTESPEGSRLTDDILNRKRTTSPVKQPIDEVTSTSNSSYLLPTPDIQDSSSDSNVKSTKTDKSESNYCEICNKSFIRLENLTKHRRTITHIQKLSELEAKEAEQRSKLEQITDLTEPLDDTRAENTPSNDDIRESEAAEVTTPVVRSPFSNTHTIKLADIISDVLNKPVLQDGEEHNKFSDIVLQNVSDVQLEVKRYKSLGERKSFDSDTVIPTEVRAVPEPFISKTTILEKQISLLENMIENKTSKKYLDDISISSDSLSGRQSPSETCLKMEDSRNELSKPVEDSSFLKPVQYEEISEDSANPRNYEDQKMRKTLNRDEELFLECCSLLKSGSEVSSSYSNKKMHNRVINTTEWQEKKSFETKQPFEITDDYSDDNSRIPTPLGDSYDDDASNSNTISSNWDLKEQISDVQRDEGVCDTKFHFDDISKDKLQDSSSLKFDSPLFKDRTPFSSDKVDIFLGKTKTDKVCANDAKKIITKGARKVFEGLKVSIPTIELNLEEVLNCSPNSKKMNLSTESHTDSEKMSSSPTSPMKAPRKSKPVKKSQVGSNLLFKVNKKKTLSPNSFKKDNQDDSKNYDVYDFEETQDNMDVFTKPDYKAFRTMKNGEPINEIESETESRDYFDYFGLGDSVTSSMSSSLSSMKKPKAHENKKKCMIMGRIFKNAAAKTKVEDIDEEIRDIPTIDNEVLVESYVADCKKVIRNEMKPKLSEREINHLFDQLLENKTNDKEVTSTKPTTKSKPDNKKKVKVKGKKRVRTNSDSTDDEFNLNKTKKRSSRKNGKEEDNCINLEQELKECIGVASRKSQRKCTSGKQNVLVEYWSSDDSQFEALLESQRIKTKPTVKPVEEGVSDQVTPCDQTEELLQECDKSTGVKKKPLHKRKSTEKKKNKSQDSGTLVNGSASSRRKRAAANPLYHWSSSSEDEAGDLIEVKPLREEFEDNAERPVQHGWIVGESPKKLVMMLAHAKGKKTDIDCVKEQGKKRTNTIS